MFPEYLFFYEWQNCDSPSACAPLNWVIRRFLSCRQKLPHCDLQLMQIVAANGIAGAFSGGCTAGMSKAMSPAMIAKAMISSSNVTARRRIAAPRISGRTLTFLPLRRFFLGGGFGSCACGGRTSSESHICLPTRRVQFTVAASCRATRLLLIDTDDLENITFVPHHPIPTGFDQLRSRHMLNR